MSVISTDTKKVSLKGFFHEVWLELKRISWTTKEELFLSTRIVLMATLFFGFSVYGVDLVIHTALRFLNHLTKVIVG